ncbi:MAG: hypothetical protein SNJ57_09460 [Cyanobacteriota bacterium]
MTDRKTIQKAIRVIRDALDDGISVLDADLLREPKTRDCAAALGLGVGDSMYVRLTWNFAPWHYRVMEGFVKDYEAVIEAEMLKEQAIADAIYEEVFKPLEMAGFDELYDDMGCPDFVVIVYNDRVEVKAFETGVGEIIPRRSRRYIGDRLDIRWRYPLSSLPELEKLGRPVINAADLKYA